MDDELVAYLRREVARKEADGATVHVHFHQAPANTTPVEIKKTFSERMMEIFPGLLLALLLLACLVVIVFLLAPVLLALLALAAVALAAAVALILAATAGIKHLGVAKINSDLAKAALRKKR